MPIRKVLIANRGEIAVRIARTLRTLGLKSVGVYHASDALGLAVREADGAIEIAAPTGVAAYLDVEAAAGRPRGERARTRSTRATAFSPRTPASPPRSRPRACASSARAAEVIDLMGDKIRARARVARAGFPITPSTTEEEVLLESSPLAFEQIGFPLLIKASAGGGGRGMRIVRARRRPGRRVRRAPRGASVSSATGGSTSSAMWSRARHIEVQVLGDAHGKVVAPCRARMLRAAPFPEAHRRDAVAARSTSRRSARAFARRRSASPAPPAIANAGTVEFIFAPSASSISSR